jgi:hypothetical protein
MLRPMVRSLVSAVMAACFALSVASWGRPAECAGHSIAAGHHDSHDPSGRHHEHPSGRGCAVHLCCAHLVLESPVALAADRLADAAATAGVTAAPGVPLTRPAHVLPFAQAPPVLS